MNLDTPRLTLRKLAESDAADLYDLEKDLQVRQYLDDMRPPSPWETWREQTIEKIRGFAQYGPDLGFWSARLADGTFAGWLHLRPGQAFPGEMELGYRLHSSLWGRGLATEAAGRLLKYGATELGLDYIIATALARNVGSRRVMEKIGMRFERPYVVPEERAPYWTEEQRAAVKYAWRV